MADIHPDTGQQVMLAAVRRLSLRHGFSVREWLQPETAYQAEISLPPLAVTLPPGHRLGVFVSASNHDRFDINFQDGSNLSDEPGASPVVAAMKLLTGEMHPSRLLLTSAAVPEPDSDLDGLPDWWETIHGADGADPDSDDDSDGAFAWQEYAAGTDPGSNASVFKTTSFQHGSTAFLEWSSVESRRYDVWQSTDLRIWTRIAENLPGTPPDNRYELPAFPIKESYFLRVSTSRLLPGL